MEIDGVELDRIIEGLNKGKTISSKELDNLDDSRFTEIEKDFFKKFKPECSLIIYGSLAPNRPNHSVIEHINGKYQKVKIKGKLEKKGWGAELGFLGFRHASSEEQIEIEGIVLFSEELVENWQLLDDFEGEEYRRILAKYESDTGEIGVGNIYAINEAITETEKNIMTEVQLLPTLCLCNSGVTS